MRKFHGLTGVKVLSNSRSDFRRAQNYSFLILIMLVIEMAPSVRKNLNNF